MVTFCQKHSDVINVVAMEIVVVIDAVVVAGKVVVSVVAVVLVVSGCHINGIAWV